MGSPPHNVGARWFSAPIEGWVGTRDENDTDTSNSVLVRAARGERVKRRMINPDPAYLIARSFWAIIC